jgi:hypothetical protein
VQQRAQVRQALAHGRLDLVEQWLDRPYAVIVHLPAVSNAPTGQQLMQCGSLQSSCGTASTSTLLPLQSAAVQDMPHQQGAPNEYSPATTDVCRVLPRVLQQSFQNQPPGQGTYEAVLSPADGDCASADSDLIRVAVEITVMGQAQLQPIASDWPAWIAHRKQLRLTF